MPDRRPRLIVMVKEPRPGRVKTRLGRQIGMVPAAWWFRHQCLRLLCRLRDPRWEVILAVSPDAAGMSSRVWPPDLRRIPQGAGDLGARMTRLMRHAPRGPVVIVGADIPSITGKHIAAGFAALGRADAVLGPAPDGGYWLIGHARRRPVRPDLLDNVRWSTPHALADTRARMRGLRLAQVATLADVDTLDDLKKLEP